MLPLLHLRIVCHHRLFDCSPLTFLESETHIIHLAIGHILGGQ